VSSPPYSLCQGHSHSMATNRKSRRTVIVVDDDDEDEDVNPGVCKPVNGLTTGSSHRLAVIVVDDEEDQDDQQCDSITNTLNRNTKEGNSDCVSRTKRIVMSDDDDVDNGEASKQIVTCTAPPAEDTSHRVNPRRSPRLVTDRTGRGDVSDLSNGAVMSTPTPLPSAPPQAGAGRAGAHLLTIFVSNCRRVHYIVSCRQSDHICGEGDRQ
jgi:hypothetical protein